MAYLLGEKYIAMLEKMAGTANGKFVLCFVNIFRNTRFYFSLISDFGKYAVAKSAARKEMLFVNADFKLF